MNAVIIGMLAVVTVWMAPDGNDQTGNGSKEKPVATLAKAVEKTREITSDDDKKIVVKDGFYRFDGTVTLENCDAWLTIEAEHKGKAVFSGARAVTGWKQDPKDKRFLVADFPFQPQDGWTYSFAANGLRGEFSCFPAGRGRATLPYIAGYADIPKKNHTVIKYDPRTLPYPEAMQDLDLLSVKIFIPQEWASRTLFIATNDWQNNTFYLAGKTDMPIGMFNQGYKIYNARVGMTAPGSWMYSIAANQIVYWPREGETAADLKGEVSALGQLMTLKTHDVTLRGLVLEGCAKSVKMKDLDGAIVGCQAGCGHGTVIEGCEFRNSVGKGFASYHAQRVRIRRSYAHHLDGDGFWLYGGGDTVMEDNETAYLPTGLSFYSHAKVLRNHVHHTWGCGLIAWSTFCDISSNHIHHTMMTLRDGGGLYGAQTNCRFVGNYCHDNGEWPGLYNDEGGQYTVYQDNVFENDYWPFHMHDNYGITWTNNTFIGRNGMLFSFQGSVHCVFKDNIIRTAMPFEGVPGELQYCDVWDNEIQMIQPDGSIVTNRLAYEKQPLAPAASAQACEMTEAPVDAQTGKWTGKGYRGGRRISCSRGLDGILIPGIPGGGASFAYYGDYLYIFGNYEYNKVAPYDGCYNNAGHVWGVNDGVRFLFKGFSVDVHFDRPKRDDCGTFVVSDNSFSCDTTNCFAQSNGSAGAGGRKYRLRIPLQRLGVDPKNALGAKIPMNVIFYNGDHREYKYYATPAKNGWFASLFGGEYDYLTGMLELVPFVRNNYGFANLQEGCQDHPERTPSARFRGAEHSIGINTVARPGDDFRRDGKSGYDALDEYLRGFMIRHRAAKGEKFVQDFAFIPFRTEEDPPDEGVFTRHVDKASEYCESGKNPGYYLIKLEDWQLGAGHTASANCVYSWYDHSIGGISKLYFDTQDGPDGTVTLAEGGFQDGVFEGHNHVKGLDGRERDAYVKIAFNPKPVAIRELKPNGKQGKRYILDFMIKPKQKILVKGAVSEKSLAEAQAKFAADDPAKGFYDYSKAAKDDWKSFFDAIPHEGTDAEHKAFYTDRYFKETK